MLICVQEMRGGTIDTKLRCFPVNVCDQTGTCQHAGATPQEQWEESYQGR